MEADGSGTGVIGDLIANNIGVSGKRIPFSTVVIPTSPNVDAGGNSISGKDPKVPFSAPGTPSDPTSVLMIELGRAPTHPCSVSVCEELQDEEIYSRFKVEPKIEG
jgi:hypothetical protein